MKMYYTLNKIQKQIHTDFFVSKKVIRIKNVEIIHETYFNTRITVRTFVTSNMNLKCNVDNFCWILV